MCSRALKCRKMLLTLPWRHNENDDVSNHQPHDCLFKRLFRRRSKKTSKLCVTGLCAGNSPHKWPVTRKMFPFDDVIMKYLNAFDAIFRLRCDWETTLELGNSGFQTTTNTTRHQQCAYFLRVLPWHGQRYKIMIIFFLCIIWFFVIVDIQITVLLHFRWIWELSINDTKSAVTIMQPVITQYCIKRRNPILWNGG